MGQSALLNLIKHELYADKIYLYAKDPFEAKQQFLINKHKGAALNHCNYYKTYIEYSNDKDDIYENIEEFTPNKERKILIVFDMIASNKKLYPLVTELFIRGKKINIFLFYHAI